MNLTIETGVPLLTVWLQGLLSFFSPCVFPLIPLYISYLAGGGQTVDEEGKAHYPRKRILIHTIFFILGIGFAFVLLGVGFTTVGRMLGEWRTWFVRISGMIMILFGLYQLGVLGRSMVIERERRLPFRLDRWRMSPVIALILGFTFSFAWTPCVGPVLASVLLMASTASTQLTGLALIGVYMIGFVLPFLVMGLFTGYVLEFFNRHKGVIQYTVKIGGALLIVMGIMTLTGWMNGITGYLSSFGAGTTGTVTESQEAGDQAEDADQNGDSAEDQGVTDTQEATDQTESESSERAAVAAPDFTLVDQYGETHTLSDYKGKTIFLNFWATWCGPCRQEMPDIQKLYEEFGENSEDLVFLGVANPKTDEAPTNQDVSQDEVTAFLEENGYTYPVVMDLDGSIFYTYGVSAFPTTFMIDAEGNVYGYVTGTLTEDVMRSIISQTMDSLQTDASAE